MNFVLVSEGSLPGSGLQAAARYTITGWLGHAAPFAFEPSYRLSVCYIARLVRLDPDRFDPAGPVVASRLGFGTARPLGAGA